LLYTPENDFICALWRPNSASKASLISPNVARFLAASTAKANKFSLPVLAALVNLDNAVLTSSVLRLVLMLSKRSICCVLTV